MIDVINTRLRSIVLPITMSASLDELTLSFARIFPSLETLPVLLSHLSAGCHPFREMIPPDSVDDGTLRHTYLDALAWLLKNELVVQCHARARIQARPQIKETAWRQLWHRRHARWLAMQREKQEKPEDHHRSLTSSTFKADAPEPSSDLITPRALPPVDPFDTLSSLPTIKSPPPGSSPLHDAYDLPLQEQSFMDYDPELEMDSDLGEGDHADHHEMSFRDDESEPRPEDVPHFSASFIFRPGRAQKDEARWLRAIREKGDEVWASKFDLCAVSHWARDGADVQMRSVL